jgi:hypothetical protein
MTYKVFNIGKERQMMVSSIAPRVSNDVKTPEIRELKLAHIMLAENKDLSRNIEALKNASEKEIISASNLNKHLLKEIKSNLYDLEIHHNNLTFTSSSSSIPEIVNLASRKITSEAEKDFKILIKNPEESTEELSAKLILLEESLILLKSLNYDNKQINHLEKKIDSIKTNIKDFAGKVKSYYKNLEALEKNLENSKETAEENLINELNKPFSFLTQEEFEKAIEYRAFKYNTKNAKEFLLRASNIYNNTMQSESILGLVKAGMLAKHYVASFYLWDFKTKTSYYDALNGLERLRLGSLISKEEYNKKVEDFKEDYEKNKNKQIRSSHSDILITHQLLNELKDIKSYFIKGDLEQKTIFSENKMTVVRNNDVAVIEGDNENVVIVYPDPFVSVPDATYAIQVPLELYKEQGIPEFTKEFRDNFFGKATNFMSMDDALTQIATDEFAQKYFFNKSVVIELSPEEETELHIKNHKFN